MNPDKRFANKLNAVMKRAQEAALKAFPDSRSDQNSFVMGWLEAEAGMRGETDEN